MNFDTTAKSSYIVLVKHRQPTIKLIVHEVTDLVVWKEKKVYPSVPTKVRLGLMYIQEQ